MGEGRVDRSESREEAAYVFENANAPETLDRPGAERLLKLAESDFFRAQIAHRNVDRRRSGDGWGASDASGGWDGRLHRDRRGFAPAPAAQRRSVCSVAVALARDRQRWK